MQKVLLGVLAALALVALGDARSYMKREYYQGASPVKGGVKTHPQISIYPEPVEPERIEIIVITDAPDVQEEYDEVAAKKKDPDFVPNYDEYDYDDDADYPKDDVDYGVVEEEEENPTDYGDGTYEDKLWSKDDDPDYVPDYSQLDDSSEEDDDDDHVGQDDDLEEDPDYDPDYSKLDDSSEGDDDDNQVEQDNDLEEDPDYDPDYSKLDDSSEGDDDDNQVEQDNDLEEDPDYDPDYSKLDDSSERYDDDDYLDQDEDLEDDPDYVPDYNEVDDSSVEYDEELTDDGVSGHLKPSYDVVPAELIGVKGSVKGKRQTKSQGGFSQQQYGQVQYEVDGGHGQSHVQVGQIHQVSHNQQEPVIQTGNQANVAEGVEALSPASGGNTNPISAGVEAIDGEAGEGSPVSDWFGQGWGHVVNTFDAASDNVGDTFDEWGDTISNVASGAVDTIQDAASHVADAASTAVDAVHDAAHTAGDTIVSTYHNVRGKLPELRERITVFFKRFGFMVQRGADYCIQHLGIAVNQVQEAEILDKLRQKLADGNEQVTYFFTLLGEKTTSWAQSHGQYVEVDSGLITLESQQEGGVNGDVVGAEGQLPNLFQDQDVIVQMNQMVNSGVITQGELELLSQQRQQVDFNQSPYQQDSSRIQILRHHRGLRSQFRGERVH